MVNYDYTYTYTIWNWIRPMKITIFMHKKLLLEITPWKPKELIIQFVLGSISLLLRLAAWAVTIQTRFSCGTTISGILVRNSNYLFVFQTVVMNYFPSTRKKWFPICTKTTSIHNRYTSSPHRKVTANDKLQGGERWTQKITRSLTSSSRLKNFRS